MVEQTMAQYWEEKYKREGRAEDRAEGRAEGLEHATREALRTVLMARFGTVPKSVAAAIQKADLATLNDWLRLAATASSRREVGIRSRGRI